MSLSPIRLLAANHALGHTHTQQVIQTAHDVLERGIYSHSLGELVCLRQPQWADVLPLLISAFRELEVEIPTPEDATEITAAYVLQNMIEGRTNPEGVINQLYIEWSFQIRRSSPQVFQDSRFDPLRRLVGMDDDYGLPDIWGYTATERDEARGKLDREAFRVAIEWCYEYADRNFQPGWRTSDVIALAQTIESERAFDRLPILADALEEAGCNNVEVLEHCRGHEQHTRGCWVLDLVLGITTHE